MLIERNISEMNHKEEQRSDKLPSTREARRKSAPPYCRTVLAWGHFQTVSPSMAVPQVFGWDRQPMWCGHTNY